MLLVSVPTPFVPRIPVGMGVKPSHIRPIRHHCPGLPSPRNPGGSASLQQAASRQLVRAASSRYDRCGLHTVTLHCSLKPFTPYRYTVTPIPEPYTMNLGGDSVLLLYDITLCRVYPVLCVIIGYCYPLLLFWTVTLCSALLLYTVILYRYCVPLLFSVI